MVTAVGARRWQRLPQQLPPQEVPGYLVGLRPDTPVQLQLQFSGWKATASLALPK